MVYEFMRDNKNKYSITKMTGLLGVARSAYYKWRKYGRSGRRKDADAALYETLKEICERHRFRYGRPRVQVELRKKGIMINHKRLARLMRKYDLNARIKRKHVATTDSGHALPVCENILNRDFHAVGPGKKWVSDITYLWTTSGWLYLTTVMDLYDRKIIGWAFSTAMDAPSTVIPALVMACMSRPPEQGLIFHSDRGVQYCCRAFRSKLAELCPSVRQSMSGKGNCWDNACAESFFKTLKRELETLDGKHTEHAVRVSVFEYIEGYYNRLRLHSALDYSVPVEVIYGIAA
jgi:transposase InsO family protein